MILVWAGALCLTLYFGKITVVNWFWFVYAFNLVEILEKYYVLMFFLYLGP